MTDGVRSWSYAEHYERVRRAAGAVRRELCIAPGNRVATLLPNLAAMLELHYAVPDAGGVLVPLNTRLTGADYAHSLDHSGASAVVAAESLRAPLEDALDRLGAGAPRRVGRGCRWRLRLRAAAGRRGPGRARAPGGRAFPLSINYTSGTTGLPKGVMTTSHRGAYLHILGVIAEAGLGARSTHLWTLPMFHCNGWAYTWAVTATGARHVCLPAVDPPVVWRALHAEGITHACAAPTVITMLLGAEEASPCPSPVRVFVGGSPPSPSLLERAASLNIDVTHLYGLTETYGPIAVCAWNPDWDERPVADKARLRARQGVGTNRQRAVARRRRRHARVPRDGETLGEVVMGRNNVMLGYYRDEEATRRAFAGGWLHSGDLTVVHPDGYIELRDRLKDIVISGGENIATIEVEQALVAHDAIAEAAVIRQPDEKWGEVPVAFVTTRGGAGLDPEEVKAFLRERIARYKVSKRIAVLDELPKTGTGKIQKFVLREQGRAGSR